MRLTPKILFIDDDKFFLEFYRSELAQYNFSTDFAQDGEEGIKKAREIKPDIILLDVILPKKDGFEVLKELKSHEETKDIPVVIISTLSSESDIESLLKLGAIKSFNKLTDLPKDVANYIKNGMEADFESASKSKNEAETTQLSAEQTNEIFTEGVREMEDLLNKLFHKKISLEDINVAMLPFSKFKDQIKEVSSVAGTIFIYSKIEAENPGLAILSIERNDTLNLIKLIEEGTVGKEMGLSMSDQVVEEFFNIAVNAFLNKLAASIPGRYLLQSPIITSPSSVSGILSKAKISPNNLVAYLGEAFLVEELDLSFSIFIIFDEQLFEKS